MFSAILSVAQEREVEGEGGRRKGRGLYTQVKISARGKYGFWSLFYTYQKFVLIVQGVEVVEGIIAVC